MKFYVWKDVVFQAEFLSAQTTVCLEPRQLSSGVRSLVISSFKECRNLGTCCLSILLAVNVRILTPTAAVTQNSILAMEKASADCILFDEP